MQYIMNQRGLKVQLHGQLVRVIMLKSVKGNFKINMMNCGANITEQYKAIYYQCHPPRSLSARTHTHTHTPFYFDILDFRCLSKNIQVCRSSRLERHFIDITALFPCSNNQAAAACCVFLA